MESSWTARDLPAVRSATGLLTGGCCLGGLWSRRSMSAGVSRGDPAAVRASAARCLCRRGSAPPSTAAISATDSCRLAWHTAKRPCLAPSSRAKAMPGPDPPHHAKPRREVFSCGAPPSSGVPQRGHLLDVEPPVVAGLLRPPVAEPDTAAARGQPRHQLISVHQFLVDVGPRRRSTTGSRTSPACAGCACVLSPPAPRTAPWCSAPRPSLRSGRCRNRTPRSRSSSPRAPADPAWSSWRSPRSLPEALLPVPWVYGQLRDRGTAGTRGLGAAGRRRRCGCRLASP